MHDMLRCDQCIRWIQVSFVHYVGFESHSSEEKSMML